MYLVGVCQLMFAIEPTVPPGGRLPAAVGRLHLVGVPAVGPEEEQPVEQRLDVGHVGLPLGEDGEDAALRLLGRSEHSSWSERRLIGCCQTGGPMRGDAPPSSLC